VVWVARVKFRHSWQILVGILIPIQTLLDGPDVVVTASERGLPVLLVQMRLVKFIVGARTWRWITIPDFRRDLVIVVPVEIT
jgi:hypothetical protein